MSQRCNLPQPDDTPGHPANLCVSLVPIFNHLSGNDLAVIAGKARMRTFQRGQFIHRAGDPFDQLYIVHRGKVKIYRLSDAGKVQLVRLLEPGDFAGELGLFVSSTHDSYAEVLAPSEICLIKRSDLRELLRQYPDISLHVIDQLSDRLATSEKQTAVIATESVNARLALYLAGLAEESGGPTIRLPMTRRHLASFLGTTPETVSRRLGAFEAAGWIQQTGQRDITICNLNALLKAG